MLDRFCLAAREANPADAVVRITADCPLLDPGGLGPRARRVRRAARPGVDYVSNVHPPTYPDGLDTEVFSVEALETAWREARLPSDREHVTPFIWSQPERFRLANVEHARGSLGASLDRGHRGRSRVRPRGVRSARPGRRAAPGMTRGADGCSPSTPRSATSTRACAATKASSDRSRADREHATAEDHRAMTTPRRFDRSMAMLARARRSVPGASQTLSQGRRHVRRGRLPGVPRARPRLPRLGRGRQRVRRLHPGPGVDHARLRLSGGHRGGGAPARARGASSRCRIRSRSRWPSGSSRSSRAPRWCAS